MRVFRDRILSVFTKCLPGTSVLPTSCRLTRSRTLDCTGGQALSRRYVASMSSDLIAWVVAVTLGIAVVVIGLRRNLSEATRNGMPRFGGDPERTTPTLEGEERRRRPLSRRQKRWMAGGFLLLGLTYAVMALLWANDRLIHAVFAALWATIAVAYFLGKLPLSANRFTS